jgi:hypothetical protein
VLTLALLITLSAAGINMSLHRCCGSIQSFSFFGNAKECKMAKIPSHKPSPSKANLQKEPCCSTQQISFRQSSDSTNVATKSTQIKENEHSFDVLFVYNLFKTWFGSSDQEEKETQKPSPGLFILEALILLLQQFRI